MSTITNSINNLVNIPSTMNISQSVQKELVKQSIQSSIIDTVNFSDEAKSLFQISEIDKLFDGIFGIPNELTSTQQDELDTLRLSLDKLSPNSSSTLQTLDFDKTYNHLVDSFLEQQINLDTKSDALATLSNELKSYLAERSLSQLTGETNPFTLFSQGFTILFDEKITEEESTQLSTVALQLNRLFFAGDDSQTASFLDTFNNLYGLNTPDENQLNQAIDLLAQRNSLLSSVLSNRDFNTTYAELL